MAKTKDVTMYAADDAGLALAREAAERENKAVKEVGKGKERKVFKIETQDAPDVYTLRGYVVHIQSDKARSCGAVAIGLTATDVDGRRAKPAKSLVEQLATMSPDEVANLRRLLASLDAPPAPPAPPADPIPYTEPPVPRKKGK